MNIGEKISLRVAFGQALAEAGKYYPDLRVLDAGTKNSTMSNTFEKDFPTRFYTPGINELGMVSLATGMAMAKKRVVACDMSVFLHHAYAQIREAVRQGQDLHLIIAASHTGVAVGPDGGSAHDLTDLARMRLIPYLKVITPCDGNQVRNSLMKILEEPGFYYVRLNRPAVPVFTEEKAPFEIGQAQKLLAGERITLIAVGDKSYPALEAARQLGAQVAEVISISTLEPLDEATIIASAQKTRRVVTIEDHMCVGGLFEAVAGVLARHCPTPMRSISVGRMITTSGEPNELAELYGLNQAAIVRTCEELLAQ